MDFKKNNGIGYSLCFATSIDAFRVIFKTKQ